MLQFRLFGHVSELDWHANQVSRHDRYPLIWLYAVKGSEGSQTSWLNMAKVWEALSEEQKEIAKTKLPDLNCSSIESAMKVIEGTAKNMGVSIKD